MKKLLLPLILFTTCSLTAQDVVRNLPYPINFESNSFKDQLDVLELTVFNNYESKSVGWRESYLQPKFSNDVANAFKVWGSWYFPYTEGGMTKRWQAKNNEATTPALSDLNWSLVKKMSKDEINKLSPCEKVDIYFGNTDFRITKHEMYWRGKLRGKGETSGIILSTLEHEGFCNGARAAGALTLEPQNNITLKSLLDTNIKITFYPLDIKMLATLSYFHMDTYRSNIIGGNSADNQRDFNVNAAVFDIALRSIIGGKAKAFFMDLDPMPGVAENVSIVGYKRNVSSEELNSYEKTMYPNADHKLTAFTKIYILAEVPVIDADSLTTTDIGNHKKFVDSLNCFYYLFIEKQTNNILDGSWHQTSFVPDNIWFASGYGSDDVYVYHSPISSSLTFDDKNKPRLGNPYLSGIFVYNLVMRSAGW